MHGYFVSLKLYDAARVIANPFAYDEHRAKLVRDKMDKMSESRIRAKKEVGVKVNKALAEKILRDEEKAQKRAEKKNKRKQGTAKDVDMEAADKDEGRDEEVAAPSILSDPRFAKVFENPEFAIDETSREFALLNPSSVGQTNRGKTVVEEEEEESDKLSSDGLDGSDDKSEDDDDKSDSSDSSDEGGSYLLLCILNTGFLKRTLPYFFFQNLPSLIVDLVLVREIFVLKKLTNEIEREIGPRRLIWFLYVLKLPEARTVNDLGIKMLPLVNVECHVQNPQPENQPENLLLEPTMKKTMRWKLAGCLHLRLLLLVGRTMMTSKTNQRLLKISLEKELRRLVLGLREVSKREWNFRMTRRGKGDHIGGKE